MLLGNKHEQAKRDNHIKKLVSNARAIISNQIALPLGVSKMTRILFCIDRNEPLENINLKVFSEYMSQTADFPIGTERLTYNRTFLKQQDKQLDKLTIRYKDQIIDKCFEIIEKLTNKSKIDFIDKITI